MNNEFENNQNAYGDTPKAAPVNSEVTPVPDTGFETKPVYNQEATDGNREETEAPVIKEEALTDTPEYTQPPVFEVPAEAPLIPPAAASQAPAQTPAPKTYQILVDPKTGQYVYANAPTAPASTPYAQPSPAPYGQPYTPQAPEAKPKSRGSKAFMIVLIVLLAVFSIGFFMLCGYLLRDYFASSLSPVTPTSPSQETTLPTGDTPSNIIPSDKNENPYSKDTVIDLVPLPSDKDDTSKYTTQYAYNIISDSTVGVVCYVKGNNTAVKSQGTGIIISEDGYIVTNSHVIGDSKTLYDVRVTTVDGTSYEAIVVGYDSRTDLAVLKVNGKNMKAAAFADSDEAYIGQDVIAVGNPGGMDFQNSLTKGILSAKDRKLNLSTQVSFLQTDAAINPGNSGGALCNLHGQVIGVTSAKISSDAYEGMGFAIPSRTVKEVVDDLVAQGFVEGRVRIGITGQAVTSAMMQYYDIPSGILVSSIDEDGPCADTELEKDDIITMFDGKEIKSFSDMYNYLAEHKAGDKVTLTVYRMETDETFEIEITLMADDGATQN